MSPALVVLSGLPGVGKTTVARALAGQTGAVHLRIDTIEAALRRRGMSLDGSHGDTGYLVAYGLARDCLMLGQSVIVDAVHGWSGAEALATGACAGTGARLFRVTLSCSDEAAHRVRVETRGPDQPGEVPPTWSAVLARSIAPFPAPELALDTAVLAPEAAAEAIRGRMNADRNG